MDHQKFDNGQTYFIFNYTYSHGRIALPDDNTLSVYEGPYYSDQLWFLEDEPKHPGYYYIVNAHRERYRIAKPAQDNISAYDGNYYNDQLWRFQKEGDYYRIFNYEHPQCKLARTSDSGKLITYDGPDYDDQLWKLVPRYEANIKKEVVWSCDNRQGSEPFEETVEITKGIKLTNSSTLTTKTGFRQSIKSSISASLEGLGSAGIETEMEFSAEIDKSTTSSDEKNWTTKRSITFSAPAGKNYRVLQNKAAFKSLLASDDCQLSANYFIEETTGEFST